MGQPEISESNGEMMKRYVRRMSASIVVLFLMLIGLGVYNYVQQARVHESFCGFYDNLIALQQEQKDFLAMTPEERTKKFGPAVGAIPESVIRAQIQTRQVTLDSLSDLHC